LNSDLRRANHADGVAETRDGTNIRFLLHGDTGDDKRRAVLIHSLAMDATFWRPVIERLDAAVLVCDCRGHGRSDKPRGPYTVELFADDIADVLDHVGWDAALVAGASMGGCVSLAFASAYPRRTRALGLIDTTAWYGSDAPKQWAERAGKAAQDGMAALVDFQTTRWFGDGFRARHPDVVKQSVDVFLRNDVKAYVETCRMLGSADLRAALPRLTMPTAVIVGEEDYATPVAMAQALHDGIAGSTLTVLPKARHLTPLEVPDIIAAELERLMARAGQ
jgi:3-oxoadipate enol-lactonase